ncbi:MAG: TetR family transcriptional regulator [Luteolibacter sp.]
MDRTSVPESGAKLKLVEAAEALFAERGFESVSVRDITKKAAMNIASVNYHFGSRDGLVAAVMTRYVTPINEERIVRLDTAERRWTGKTVPLEEVLEAFVRPMVTQVRRSELSERLFLKLVGRTFGEQGNAMPPALIEQFKVVCTRFVKALSKALPGLATDEILWRMHFVVGAMYHAMAQEDVLQMISQGASGNPTIETTLARFTRFAAAGLRNGLEGGDAVVAKGPQATFDF